MKPQGASNGRAFGLALIGMDRTESLAWFHGSKLLLIDNPAVNTFSA